MASNRGTCGASPRRNGTDGERMHPAELASRLLTFPSALRIDHAIWSWDSIMRLIHSTVKGSIKRFDRDFCSWNTIKIFVEPQWYVCVRDLTFPYPELHRSWSQRESVGCYCYCYTVLTPVTAVLSSLRSFWPRVGLVQHSFPTLLIVKVNLYRRLPSDFSYSRARAFCLVFFFNVCHKLKKSACRARGSNSIFSRSRVVLVLGLYLLL